MAKKIIWILVSCLMVLSLVMASCGPGEVEEEEEEELLPPTEPKHGGTLEIIGGELGAIDPTINQAIRCGHMQWTSSELMQGDWSKGPQGTGETAWDWGFLGDITLESGELAESWELPDDETIIYNLRKGIYYHDKPPANGRELTADDVVWNIQMQFNYPPAWQTIAYPPTEPAVVTGELLPGDPRRPTSVKTLDEYTVEVKVPAASQAIMLLEIGDNLYTNPPECWTEGDGWKSWEDIVGSGPWILADYVTGSYVTYEKHPSYFESDPIHPGNRWPYLDAVKLLIIPDRSSQLAAFRTAKIDMMAGFGAVTVEEFEDTIKRCPDLEWSSRTSTPAVAAGRVDKAGLPFYDIRVRQAMNLAVNQKEILRDYLKGEGVMLGYPFAPTKGFEKFYTPLEEMPEEVQMLFTYDPERARELLAEAGYPDGFKTTIVCTATSADEVSMLKAYLADADIDMEIQTVESGQWFSMRAEKAFEEMSYGVAAGLWAPFEQLTTKRGMVENVACIDDPYFDEVGKVIGRDMVKDPENYFNTMKEAAVYELSLAWAIWMPCRYLYNMWWPWVQNYYGISWSGWANISDWYKGIWIDQELKKSMGY
jgi:peptide/nickel transport system substrate-binding protein